MGPSRADGSDNWGRDRRALPPRDDDRREATGGLADRYGPDRADREPIGPSKADTEDRWSRREPLPPPADAREPMGPSKADTEDRWSRRAPPPADFDSREPLGPSKADSEDRWSRRVGSCPASTHHPGYQSWMLSSLLPVSLLLRWSKLLNSYHYTRNACQGHLRHEPQAACSLQPLEIIYLESGSRLLHVRENEFKITGIMLTSGDTESEAGQGAKTKGRDCGAMLSPGRGRGLVLEFNQVGTERVCELL